MTSRSSSSGGSDGTDVNWVSAAGYNYGFNGITRNDFGLQFGAGIQHNRLGFKIQKNYGLIDWGDNNYFGNQKEKVGFTNFQITYLIKK